MLNSYEKENKNLISKTLDIMLKRNMLIKDLYGLFLPQLHQGYLDLLLAQRTDRYLPNHFF